MKKTVHSERLNFTLSPHLKKSIEIAAHANLISVSDYLRGLVYKDLMDNSDFNEEGCFYIAKHKLDD